MGDNVLTLLSLGTKIDVECSAMGTCDESTGQCRCLNGYSSSDGTLNSPGERYGLNCRGLCVCVLTALTSLVSQG